ncbi:hypothetical protein SAMN04487967_0980 [Natronorubrum sediminis]|uniref:DUF7511 domain-containing protein n=2 Tax=Natronorubrum sediminis TaxID=640943 RepID=A0A1H6FPH1_9EURY|nr:hypothetical protein SAMN04487967_0980 [Natronorubrum sediminis]
MTDGNTDGETEPDASSNSTGSTDSTNRTERMHSRTASEPTSPDGDVSPCYQAYVERNETRPDTCTIYSSVTAATLEETWIRATGSAFVSRDEIR